MTAARLFESSVTDAGELVFWSQPSLEYSATARVILVGCTATKRPTAATARSLYEPSALFRARRAYAEAAGGPWAVLSALHGLVNPSTMIEPYDYTIDERRRDGSGQAWAVRVIQAAHRLVGIGASVKPGEQFATYDAPLVLEVHAGRPYVELLEAVPFRNVTIEHPVAGLQIGQQLAHYKAAASC